MCHQIRCKPAFACALISALLLLAVILPDANAQGLSPGTLNLSSDATTAPVHRVVHLSATFQASGSPASGNVTFFDNGDAIAVVPLNTRGVAALGVATLAPGAHTLAATYAGGASYAGRRSAPFEVSILGVGVPFTIANLKGPVYAHQAVTVTAVGLPSAASGSFSFLDGSATLAAISVPGVSTPAYQAFGDGITLGQSVSAAESYPNLFASRKIFSAANLGTRGSAACDLLPFSVLANGLGPTQVSAPLSSVMIGSTEMDQYGTETGAQTYLPVFNSCLQAALSWLAIPREYKVLSGDASAAVTSGTWTSHSGVFDGNYGTLMNTTGSGTARFTLTSSGGPVYLWYLLGDALSGSFSLTMDGVADATAYSTQPTPAIGSLTHSPGVGFGFLRFPMDVGTHTFDVNVQSGTVGILGVGTPPSPGSASVHPTVFVSDIPLQLTNAPIASAALIASYTQAIQSSVTQFQGDGLDLRMVSTQRTMLGAAEEMSGPLDPNALGAAHLAQAFESAFGNSSTAPYASFNGSAPTASVSFNTAGTHTIVGAYAGDGTYAAANSPPVSVTVLPQLVSVISLSTRTGRYPSGSPVGLVATVTPASATGTVTFFDGPSFLAQETLATGLATFTTSTLALGVHTLTAVYNGDAPNASSSSPQLQIDITPGAPTVTLNPLPATVLYGALTSLTATVHPASATGTLFFRDSLSGTLGQAALAGGTATINAPALAVGAHTLTVSYPGDGTQPPATSVPFTLTVTALPTSTTMIAQPSQISFGTATILTATVSPAAAGGSVSFRDALSGSLGTVPVTGGVALLSTSALASGLRNLSAAYSGDAHYASSLSTLTSVAVNVTATTVILAPLPATIHAGSALTLTAAVSPASATGTLRFRDVAAGVLGQGALAHGSASLVLTSLPAGVYSITAEYAGDANDGGSVSSAVPTQVVLQSSSVTLTPISGSVRYSTALTLTANLAPADAAGIVSFYDGAEFLGQALIANGAAALRITTLTTGSHAVHAAYGGSGFYSVSTSAPIQAVIAPASTMTTLSLAEVNVPVGAPVIFNVRVSTLPGSTPGGTIVIRSNGATLASGPLLNTAAGVGYATLTVVSSINGFGTFAVTAYYSGDANDQPSNSSGTPASFTVVSSATVTSLTLSATQVPPQTPVTLTASVRNPSSLTATGSIEFLFRGVVLAIVPLDATASASTILGAQPVGLYELTSRFIPSGSWAASASGPSVLTVTLPVALVLTPNSISLVSGASADVAAVLTSLSGYSGIVQASCASSSPFVSCSVDPPGFVAGVAKSLVHVAVAQNTFASVPSKSRKIRWQDGVTLAFLLPFLVLQRKRIQGGGRMLLALSILVLISGCANGGNFGSVPPGGQLMVVSVTAAGITTTAGIAVQVGQ